MHLPPPEPRADEFYVQMGSPAAQDLAPSYQDPFDDVFGSDSEAPFGAGSHEHSNANDTLPPDIRRLQVTHSTEGYREGITVGKAQSIQAGFDEGYNLGANVGLKAGQLLGLLEGIAAALGHALAQRSSSSPHRDHTASATHASQLLTTARHELRTESIFDEAYWAPDGSWKYDVKGASNDGEILFEDVANAHPLISKWTQIVNEEVRKWSLNLDLPALRSKEPSNEEVAPKTVKLEQQSRQVMEW
ncbi:Protein YAE1 [Diatrype stigma]|uniref:Protein YAE1 n=1 Tax=Diatrype stigma TaxID=117547 RepID=A0AAN9UZ25_9PEZI